MEIKKVSVIGTGTMGNGIAHVFAQAGYAVTLIGINAESIEKALQTITRNLDRQVSKAVISEAQKTLTLNNIQTETSIAVGVQQADLVVEAVSENINLKLSIFKEIDKAAPAHAILASNTSSISITLIAAATNRPTQVIGMHFMNPVPVMKLIEIINGYKTDAGITNTIIEVSKQLQKVPCVVKDYPGFVANRILMPMINEAIIALFEGEAGVEEIDTIMKLGMAHPMGPLQLADFIGLDVCLSILQVMHNGFGNPKYAPCPLLINMVNSGNLGIKTGAGFYTYTPGSKTATVSKQFLQ